MEIVLVNAQVLREVLYTTSEHRDLNFRRPRVALVGRVLLDYQVFVLDYRQLLSSPLCSLVSQPVSLFIYMLPRASNALINHFLGLHDVPCYLLLKLIEAGEALLRSQALDEGNVDYFSVQVSFVAQ